MKQKSISLHSSEKKHPLLFFIVTSFLIFLFTSLTKNLLLGLFLFFLCLFAVAVHRLFFVKLPLNDGDIFIFYGLPGSGKTLFLTKLAEDNKRTKTIGVNEEFAHYKNKDFIYCREDLGKYSFGDDFALFYDEASLNGFDSRNHATNFQDEAILEFFKKIRHEHGSIVLANQGRTEVDKKIRDDLCKRFYHCEQHSFLGVRYCTATMLLSEESVSEITGDTVRFYRFPSLMDRLRDPTLKLYALPRQYSSLYDTYNVSTKTIYPYLIDLSPTGNAKGDNE